MSKVAIVVPCHIEPTNDWIQSLRREASKSGADVIIVDDSNGNLSALPNSWKIFGYEDQKDFLGELYEDFAKIFHKSSACRVFGHIWAYANGYDVVIGLDSDCIVPFNFVEDHLQTLNTEMNNGWINPLRPGLYPRGFPYSLRNWKTLANMGMWENVLDLNGKDRFKGEPKRITVGKYNAPAPIPFSGMNFAINREALFGFLFLPNFEYMDNNDFNNAGLPTLHEFRRIDDIWGGYIFQKLLHKLHLGVTYGQPVVYHDTVVVPEEDAKEEEAMYKFEDEFMEQVDNIMNNIISLKSKNEITINDLMKDFADYWKEEMRQEVFQALIPPFEWWSKVIQKYA